MLPALGCSAPRLLVLELPALGSPTPLFSPTAGTRQAVDDLYMKSYEGLGVGSDSRLCNGPATLGRLVERVLTDVPRCSCRVPLDNLLLHVADFGGPHAILHLLAAGLEAVSVASGAPQ